MHSRATAVSRTWRRVCIKGLEGGQVELQVILDLAWGVCRLVWSMVMVKWSITMLRLAGGTGFFLHSGDELSLWITRGFERGSW